VRVFFKHIIRFLLPVLACIVLLMIIPVDKRIRYLLMNNDCFNHGIRIHDRIFANRAPVDIAFIGSSRTINAINSQKIENAFVENQIHVNSFGYCRLGVNLNYVLFKDLLKTKRPTSIILEVRESESRFSHPVFPYLADESDVFMPYIFYNHNFLKDFYKAIVFKMQIYQQLCFKSDSNAVVNLALHSNDGFNDTADIKTLEDARLKQATKDYSLSKIEREYYLRFPFHYYKKIQELANEKGIQLYFIYMPQFGSPLKEPVEMNTYRKLGTVWIPPNEIFEDKNNWYDETHLNRTGANKLADWIIEKIKEDILKN
jgi:hypothetical protein